MLFFFTDSPYCISYMFAVFCFLLKCIRFYTANWNCIENKYAKYGGSYLKLPRYGEKSYFIEDGLLCHYSNIVSCSHNVRGRVLLFISQRSHLMFILQHFKITSYCRSLSSDVVDWLSYIGTKWWNITSQPHGLINIPNRTFLVRFGGISGEFGRAMVRITVIPMARPNEPDMPQKGTKKIRLGIYRTQIQPKI